MLDRRRFLIGAGGLLTASFVNQAKAFTRKSGKPLVLSPARKPEETLYVYRQEQWSDYGGEWRVSLGPDQPFAPPVPTWREHLRSLGHPLETEDDIERACKRVRPASGRPRHPPQRLRVGGQMGQLRWASSEGVSPAQGPRFGSLRISA